MGNELKKGDKVTFKIGEKQLSGRIVGHSYGDTYRVETEVGFFVLDDGEFGISGNSAVTDIEDIKCDVKSASTKAKRTKKK